MSSAEIFEIPDTLRNWPWKRHLNPNYDICKEESMAWSDSFNAFSAKAQKAFNLCDFNLLASLAFPLLNKDGCRIGCDLMNLFFVIDEYSDIADGKGARVQADIIMDALRNPYKPRPSGEWIGGEVARQYWENAIKTATPTAQKRFIDNFQTYTDSVVQQALDRDDHNIREVEDYFEVRRDTIGAKPSFAINEVHLNIPDEVMQHDVLKKLHSSAIDMLCIGNDICSWNVEQAKNDDLHNLVTIVMHHQKVDVHAAMKWIGELHDKLVDEFLETYKLLPSFAHLGKTEEEGKQIDADVAIYADGLGNWVRANDVWSFESCRYFGTKGTEIDRTRKCELLPKVGSEPVGYKPDFEPSIVEAPTVTVTTK